MPKTKETKKTEAEETKTVAEKPAVKRVRPAAKKEEGAEAAIAAPAEKTEEIVSDVLVDEAFAIADSESEGTDASGQEESRQRS